MCRRTHLARDLRQTARGRVGVRAGYWGARAAGSRWRPQDLLTFFQRLCLDGEARGWEPKTLRHRLLHVAGRLARHGRRVFLRLQRSWRWASLLADAFRRLRALPAT